MSLCIIKVSKNGKIAKGNESLLTSHIVNGLHDRFVYNRTWPNKIHTKYTQEVQKLILYISELNSMHKKETMTIRKYLDFWWNDIKLWNT